MNNWAIGWRYLQLYGINRAHHFRSRVNYQVVTAGTWRGILFVRHGGWNSEVIFLPTIAPTTVAGKWTNRKIMSINWTWFRPSVFVKAFRSKRTYRNCCDRQRCSWLMRPCNSIHPRKHNKQWRRKHYRRQYDIPYPVLAYMEQSIDDLSHRSLNEQTESRGLSGWTL
jgi:hypothetical protein